MNFIRNLLLATGVLFIVFFSSSCRTLKEVVYFQVPADTASKANAEGKDSLKRDSLVIQDYTPIIRHNDILEIFVTSINPEATSYFNPLSGFGTGTTNILRDNPEVLGYLVDANGEIEMPIIGAVKVAGLTIPQIKTLLKEKLEKYLEKPSVRVVLKNFKVSILGEVKLPGIYFVINERLSFPEAIAMAGDLTIFGKRENILIVREENGKKEFANVDMTQRNFFESPYYYLHPNDVLYVEPVKAKVESSDNFFRWYGLTLGTISFLMTLTLFVTR
jgi:polysaccharide export outer membrane protein